MWNALDIHASKNYRLALVQSKDGNRKFVLMEESTPLEVSEEIFYTNLVPNDLLIKRNFRKISDLVPLVSGDRFFVDAHGIWITQDEMNALLNDVDDDQVPWLNGLAPNFAPK